METESHAVAWSAQEILYAIQHYQGAVLHTRWYSRRTMPSPYKNARVRISDLARQALEVFSGLLAEIAGPPGMHVRIDGGPQQILELVNHGYCRINSGDVSSPRYQFALFAERLTGDRLGYGRFFLFVRPFEDRPAGEWRPVALDPGNNRQMVVAIAPMDGFDMLGVAKHIHAGVHEMLPLVL
jgi:hypothetical protein